MVRAPSLAILLALGLTSPALSAPCLTESRPIEGDLTELRVRTATGRTVSGYVIELDRTVCAEVTDLDGAPAELQGVANVQILATDRAGERALRRLLGARIAVIGNLDAPDPERHAGQAVLSNAELVSVLRSADSNAKSQSDDADIYDSGDPSATDAGQPEATTAANDSDGAGPADEYAPDMEQEPDPDRADVEARLRRFIESFYLSGENIEPSVIRAIYAPRVHYFGKRNTPVARIVRDKQAYYARWPAREFTLMPGTLEVRRIGYEGQIYDLSFVYDFEVSAKGRQRAGRGYARIQIDLSDGRGRIIRESGKVIERR